MTITVTPTDEVCYVDGTPTRKWEAVTDSGVRFRMFTCAVTCDHQDIPTLESLGLVRNDFDIVPMPLVYQEGTE